MTRKNFHPISAWRRYAAATMASIVLAAITCWSAVPAMGQWVQQAELTPSDEGGVFGSSVAVDANIAVIGAPNKAFGTNYGQGAAYIFVKSGGVWTQQAELTAADGALSDNFGSSVSISGNTAVIGAPQHLVNGGGRGAAYVFFNNGGNWTQAAELTAADGFFGWSVSIKDDAIAVGAIAANGQAGAAYVFTNVNGVWTQQAELTASDAHAGDDFGSSVSIDTGNLVVGAPSKVINSNQQQGAAYVFTQNGASWTQAAELIAPDGIDGGGFGFGVVLRGNTAVIGAPNGLSSNSFISNPPAGAVYVYELNSGSWIYSAKLTASDGNALNWFGQSVSLDPASGWLAVGAFQAGSSTFVPGAAYLFSQISGSWTQQAKLTSSDGASSDSFGTSVFISGNTVFAGASHRNANSKFGAVYAFGQQSSQLHITSQPSTGTVGSPIDSIVVQLEDAVGNPLSSSGVPVTIASNPAGVTGALTVNTAAGAAEFSGLTFDAANIYTLTVSSPGLTSASSEPIQISQLTQTIVFDALANQVLGTSPFSISANASSGLPVSFSSLTSTVCSVSGDTVSLLATGQCTIQATQAGNATYAAAPPVSSSFTVNPAPKSYAAPTTAVEATSSAQSATVTLNTGATLGSISVVTQGAMGKDFNVAPGGTCTVGTTYTAGEACTVNYTFTPLSPGAREGAVILKDTSGNVLGTSYLGGTGTGPLGLFTTATQTLGISGLQAVRGISLDGYGNIYGLETLTGAVDKFAAGSSTRTQLALVPATPNGGATAVDGAGNLFVTDYANGALYELVGCSGPAVKVANIASSDDNLEIDGAGNLYFSDFSLANRGAIYKISAGTYQVTTLIAGGVGRRFVGMAVDAAGNIFAADFINNVLYELPAGANTLVKLASAGYLSNPHGVAVDPAGNVYVSNYNGSTVIRYAAGSYVATLLPAAGQRGIALDGAGNLYTITTDATIAVYTRTQATPFTFATTAVGTTSDSQQGVVFENDGNADLLITGYSASSPFALNGSKNTCALGTLSSGGSCVVGATFSPLNVGSEIGTATITDNTLGVAGSAQMISLSGTSIKQTPIVAAEPATINYSSTPSVLSASVSFAGSVLPTGAVTVSVDGGAGVVATCTGSASPLSCVASYPTDTLSVGTHTLSTSMAADDNFNAASGVTLLTVNPIAPTISFGVPNHTYGDAPVTLAATSNSGAAFTYSVISGAAIISGNTLTITGAGPVVLQAAQVANGNYGAGTQNASFTVSQAQLGVTIAGTPTKNYDGTASAALTSANFTVSGLVGSDSITINQPAGKYASANAGTQTVTATLSAVNYTATSGSLSSYILPSSAAGPGLINQAPASVVVNSAGKTYGQSDPVFGGTLTGFLPGDNVTATYARAAGETVLGGPYTISATLAPAGVLSNYKVSYSTAQFTITAAPLAVSGANASRSYGAANPVFTGTISGIVNGDAITASYSSTATPASPVGTYAIVPTLSGAALANYAVTTNNGTLTVTAAPLVVTPANASRNYGAANPAFTGTISGIQNSDPITATYSTTATVASATGSYPITAQLIDPQNKLGNYSVTLNTGTLTVGKQDQLISWATPAAITYGTPLSAAQLNASVSVANPGTVTYSPAAGTVLDAGTHTLTVSVAGTAEYNPATATVQLMVNKAQPAFSGLKDASIVYHAGSAIFSGALTAVTAIPAGQQVAITVNNVTQNAVVASNGSFTTTFNAASLPVSATGYTVNYSYAGSNDFTPASATSKLTVSYAVCDLYDTTQAKQSGSTYPISVAVCDANNQSVGTSSMVLAAVGWGASAPTYSPVPDAGNSNGNGTFRNTGGAFMWNLKTTGMASGAYNVFFTISGDPTLHFAPFAVR